MNTAYKRQTFWVFETCIYLIAHFLPKKKKKKKKRDFNKSNWKSEEKAKSDEKKVLVNINAVQEESSDTLMLVGSDRPYL